MTTAAELEQVTSAQETPVFFPAGDDTLFGVFTRPIADARGTAAMLLVGGGATATNRNRISVRLARRLAEDGYHALRLDYHGVGESTGVLAHAPRVSEPFVSDVEGGLRWIHGRGIQRCVLVGSCFGGRTALSSAPQVSGVEAVVLLSPPLRDLAMDQEVGTRLALRVSAPQAVRRALSPKGLLGWRDPARRRTYVQFLKVKARMLWRLPGRLLRRRPDDSWVSRDLLEPIEALAGKGVPVLFVYGTKDYHYDDFLLARPGRLGKVLSHAPLTDVLVVEGPVHGFPKIQVQEQVLGSVVDWLRRTTTAITDPDERGLA
jgi:pimeloyl-ACP methyl ester carboxylesterase